jgi:hypothetical protein
MNHFLLSTLLSIVSTTAFAGIDPDYRCEQEGGGVAFKLPTAGASARVWQTDPEDEDALELKVVSFRTGRPAGSFEFEAKIEDALLVRGSVKDYKLTYSAFDEDAGTWVPVLQDLPCIGR